MPGKKCWILIDATQKTPVAVDVMVQDPVPPTINLNGSAPQSLIKDYTNVMQALREASDKLAGIFPHGRDFQTRPASVHDLALKQHNRRREVLARLHDEIEEMALDVQKQMHDRQRK